MTNVARSLLFVPGDRPERFDKAAASGAHTVVLDLEDAVAPPAKAGARDRVGAWLAAGHVAMVRINALDTEWHHHDLRMLHSLPNAGVMLPKANAAALASVAEALPGRRLIALLETVDGFLELPQMARVPGLERIAFGSVDFASESGISDEGETLTSVRIQIVLHSSRAGLVAPIDGVGVEFSDEHVMRADAVRSRQLGFGGKLCIHPRQIASVNEAFRPTPSEVEWARAVVTAFEVSRGGATAVNGKMIDKPVVDRARRILTQSSAGSAP